MPDIAGQTSSEDGHPGNVQLNSGGIYDVDTGLWEPTAIDGAPIERNTKAVWTGNRMIVWGGYNGSSSPTQLNTGGVYKPPLTAIPTE